MSPEIISQAVSNGLISLENDTVYTISCFKRPHDSPLNNKCNKSCPRRKRKYII